MTEFIVQLELFGGDDLVADSSDDTLVILLLWQDAKANNRTGASVSGSGLVDTTGFRWNDLFFHRAFNGFFPKEIKTGNEQDAPGFARNAIIGVSCI